MSFLMKLMGKRLIGTVEIKFYSRIEASVEYKTEATDETQIAGDLVQLEYLIRALPKGLLKFLFVSLAGMDKYYRESGDYSSVRNIRRAPDFGFATAREIFERKAQEP